MPGPSSTSLDVTVRVSGTTTQVVARGTLRAGGVTHLTHQVLEALQDRAQVVVVDLEGVTAVDEACLGVLTRMQTEAWARGAGLFVVRPATADDATLAAFDVALGSTRHPGLRLVHPRGHARPAAPAPAD